MGKVVVYKSISLDGYVAGAGAGVARPLGEGGEALHQWLLSGTDPRDAEVAAAMFSTDTVGAVAMGHTTFVCGEAPWGDDGTFRVPCFVVTHTPREPLVKGPTTFTFVTGGVKAALEEAQAAAGAKDVNVMGGATSRQALAAGLVDEVQLSVVPVLLGAGVRLFDGLGPGDLGFERTWLESTAGATHVRYRVTL